MTKCYPVHGRLAERDFRQLADAGFTVIVNKWTEDVPAYCRGAAAVDLDVMTWTGAMSAAATNDQTITREGKTTRYAPPVSTRGWELLTDRLLQEARLSLDHDNYRGVLLDFEIYDPNKTDGYCESYDDETFTGFLEEIGKEMPSPLPPPDERWDYLLRYGLTGLYVIHHSNLVTRQAAVLRSKLDKINPRFQIGVYGWGALREAVLRGVATARAPALDLDAETYGRTRFSNAFSGGYDATHPDRPGLKWSLLAVAKGARTARKRDYPVVLLGGHYPQSPGPADGTQYKFTVRQAFNSAAYADGYWIWTDWGAPRPWAKTQDWIDAMMCYFAEAHDALNAGDFTWAAGQESQVADPMETTPMAVVTGDGTRSTRWDPFPGEQRETGEAIPTAGSPPSLGGKPLRIEGTDVVQVDAKTSEEQLRIRAGTNLKAVAAGDVDGIPGEELVTLNDGWVRIWDPESGVELLRFLVGPDPTDLWLVSAQPSCRIRYTTEQARWGL